MNNAELVDWVFYQSGSFLAVTQSEFQDELKAWQIKEVVLNNSFAGVIVRRDRELHIQLEKRAALRYFRRFLRGYIQPLLTALGYLTTTAMPSTPDEVFLERCGFYKTGRVGEANTWRLDKLKIY